MSRTSKEYVLGSPLNALLIEKPFREYYLVDLDGNKMDHLQALVHGVCDEIGPVKPTIEFFRGDCNNVLLKDIFPRLLRNGNMRALCILDPYKLNFNWHVVMTAGLSKQIELFINFPLMDIERNLLRHEFKKVKDEDKARMNEFWGDDSWKLRIFGESNDLFGETSEAKSNSSTRLVEAYNGRLQKLAGFEFVAKPLAMRNSKNAIVYYLYFASPNRTGLQIVTDIFDRYRKVK